MEVLQIQGELDRAVEVYRNLKPTRVLEIGCWQGGTLKQWMQNAAPNATFVAVDPLHQNAESYLTWLKDGDTIHVYDGESQTEEAVRFMQEHGPYDWVFIDGDHDLGPAAADVENTLPLVRKGGILAMHDVVSGRGGGVLGSETVFLRYHQSEDYNTEVIVEPPYGWNNDEDRYWEFSRGIGLIHV